MRKRRGPCKGVTILLCICLVAVGLNIAYFSPAFASPAWSPMDSGTTNALYGVWGSASNDVFAVGDYGTIVHYNGNYWSAMTSGTANALNGLWGSASNDVFAVGAGGTILHYDGNPGEQWLPMSSPTTNGLYAVWGSASNDVFAVGDGGTILHFNGIEWSAMTSGTGNRLCGVWGSSFSDVFAVGYWDVFGSNIRHYDGTTWSAMTSSMNVELYGVWGSASNDVFAVGDMGTIVQYNGAAWSEMTCTTGCGSFRGVWGIASNDVFAVQETGQILHYNGGWHLTGTPEYSLNSVWGSASNDVFAVGQDGTILHYFEGAASEGEAQVSATVTLQSISVTIASGYPTAMDYGVMAPGTEAIPTTYTPGTYSYLRVENNGSVAEDLLIKGADATCGAGTWTLAASPGANQYSHLYGIGQSPVSYTPLSTAASTLGTDVATGGTVNFKLKIQTPTSSTVYGQYSTTVTILAVAH